MLTCRDLTENASAYLDGDVRPLRQARLRLHLMMCGNCRRYLDQIRQSLSAVRACCTVPVPDPAEDKLAAAFKSRFPG